MARVSTDRVAIVTGGGTGMGAATARKRVKQGGSALVTGRRRSEVLEQIAAATGAVPFAADIRDTATSQDVVDEVRTWRGRIER